MTRLRATAITTAVATVMGLGTLVLAAAPASAAVICEQYGSTTAGNYVIMNNRWGTSATQCINTTSNGFQITQQDGTGNLSGAPVSYPAIYIGCHYTNCSPNSPLPRQISQISSINSSISYTYTSSGTYDAAYDIWLDPTAKKDGVNQTEIMIWFNRQGSIQPIGSQVGTVNLAGRSWNVWQGSNGSNDVVSYVSPSAITSLSFNTLDFIRDTINRGRATTSWYLTSIQAGFEPWIGGVGLAVNSFSATINGGTFTSSSSSSSSTRTTTTTTRSSSTSSSSGGSGSCSAAYSVVGSWGGGFQANVNVTAGSAAINGWRVTLNLPSGASINNLWNGTASGTSGSVTVTNAGYNGRLNAGQTTSFGFVGNGSGSGATVSCTAL